MMKALPAYIDVFGVPNTKQKQPNKQNPDWSGIQRCFHIMFWQKRHQLRVVLGKSWGCSEVKRELNKVQMSSGTKNQNRDTSNGWEDRKTNRCNRCGLRKGSREKTRVQSALMAKTKLWCTGGALWGLDKGSDRVLRGSKKSQRNNEEVWRGCKKKKYCQGVRSWNEGILNSEE